MIDYVKGSLEELTPTFAVIEAAGVGYEVNIDLQTFTALQSLQDKSHADESSAVRLYVNEVIREDSHLLFGFLTKGERELFLLLTSVSGIGPNTARMIMSGYTAAEIRQIISTGNAAALSRIKGLGAKTAQRIIVDLKDKILKLQLTDGAPADLSSLDQPSANIETKGEAVQALTMLGFAAAASAKAVDKILADDTTASVEKVIRLALKML